MLLSFLFQDPQCLPSKPGSLSRTARPAQDHLLSSAAPAGAVFEENMVYSNEPGLYWQGKWGLRLEDDVIIKKGDCEQVSYNHADPIVL